MSEPSRKSKVLVVDDDKIVLRAVTEILRRAGNQVVPVSEAVEGLAAAKDPSIDVAMLDIRMPHVSGMELLKAIKKAREDVEVVMMTAFATVETAVEAVKAGAFDYLTKPFENIDEVSLTVARAAERKALRDRTRAFETELSQRSRFQDLVGPSASMQTLYKLIESVAPSNAAVLIQGESGTGKERVARAIHAHSPRKRRPFVPVSCSALGPTLEEELFGQLRRTGPGTPGAKKGLIESADGGTLFLDEVGQLSPMTQVRLLKLLEEATVTPLGSDRPAKVDVRVLAATALDLNRAREQGKFREDLFFRLSVLSAQLLPLRKRTEDIPPLALHFLRLYAKRSGKNVVGFTTRALTALERAPWPGNVRELEHVIERAVVIAPGTLVDLEDLPAEFQGVTNPAGTDDIATLAHLPYSEAKRLALRAFERRYLSALLERNGNNISSAARSAGVDRSNFRRLMRQYEVGDPISPDKDDDPLPN